MKHQDHTRCTLLWTLRVWTRFCLEVSQPLYMSVIGQCSKICSAHTQDEQEASVGCDEDDIVAVLDPVSWDSQVSCELSEVSGMSWSHKRWSW